MKIILLQTLLSYYIITHAIAKSLERGKFIKTKTYNWIKIKCGNNYKCPRVWSRDIGDYAEVCFTTSTKWYELIQLQSTVNIDEGDYKLTTKISDVIKAVYNQFRKLNFGNSKDKLMIIIAFSKPTQSKSTRPITTSIFIPEDITPIKRPCDNITQTELDDKRFAEHQICNDKTKIGFAERELSRKCFYAIPGGRKSDVYKRLQAEKKLKTPKNSDVPENDILNVFYPPILEQAVGKKTDGDSRGSSFTHYFEASEYLILQD